MVRRARIETKINHERWLVSYSDFITLLFAFFVVMYSVSQVSETKYKTLSDTLEKTFSPSVQTPAQEAAQSPGARASEIVEPDELAAELRQAFSGLVSSGHLALSGNEDWVELAVDSELLFESGSAKPAAEAIEIFSDVAEILAPFDNAVAVSGHTDNVPINTADFQNNWQLSSARAVSVVNLLAYGGVNPSRLSAIGYGEYRPIADNSTAQGRAANRRVVLRVARDIVPQIPVSPARAVISGEPVIDSNFPEKTEISNSEDSSGVANNDTPKSAIEPVKLKNGGLLFTSDPDLPQHRRRIE